MSTFNAGDIEARLTLKKDEFDKGLDQAKADAAKFSGKDITVKAKADTAAADKGLAGTQARADKLGKSTPAIKVAVSNAAANRQLDDTAAKAVALGRTSATLKINADSAKDAGSWMASLIAGATAVTPAFAVAGVGVAAFGALAVPVIKQVIDYQTLLGTHTQAAQAQATAAYAKMDAGQRTLVTGIASLEKEFSGLSKAVEPQVITVFNEALGVADTILPHLVPLAKEGGDAVAYLVRTLGSAATDPDARQFAHFLGQEIGPDMQAVAGLIPPVVHLLESLITDLNPLAVVTLHVASGLLSVTDSLTRVAPWLTDTAVAALALYKPIAAVIGLDIAGKFAAMAAGIGKFKDAMAAAQAAAAVDKALAASQAELAVATSGFAVAADGTAVAVGALSAAERGAAVSGALLGAVNPFVWVAAAAAGLAALIIATGRADDGSKEYVASLTKQYDATGYNITGYDKMAAAATDAEHSVDANAAASGRYVYASRASGVASAVRAQALAKESAAYDYASSRATALVVNLGALEDKYGLTQAGAEQLAAAAGVSADALAASGTAGGKAVAKVEAYAQALTGADPPSRAISNDLYVQAQDAASAASAVNKVNTAWDTFIGNAAGVLSAGNAVITALQSIAKDAGASGASWTGLNAASITLQNDLLTGLVPATLQVTDAMRKAHVSASEMAGYVAGAFRSSVDAGALANAGLRTQIYDMAVEAGYAGPNALKPLKAWIDANAASQALMQKQTQALSSQIGTMGNQAAIAAAILQTKFTRQVEQAGLGSVTSTRDVNALTAAVESTGTKSQATAGARAQLIADLEKSGVSARTAAGLVDGFIRKLGQIPAHKAVALTETGQGTFTVKQLSGQGLGVQGPPPGVGKALGGLITGGVPGRDSVLIAAMPGEVVVPAGMVNAGAVDHLRGRLPGFAQGGQVGSVGSLAAQTVSFDTAFTADVTRAMEAAMTAALKSAQSAAAASAAAASYGSNSGPAGGDAAANKALARQMFPWPASMWPAFDYLEMREAGYNRFARNASSGAYGIPQALPESKLPPAGQASGGSHAGPQLSWMFGYIRDRYGDPASAAAHERSANWYAKGSDGAAAGWAVTGEQGPELVKMRGGETVLPAHVTSAILAGGLTFPGYAKGTSGGAGALAGIIAGAPKTGWQKDVSNLKADLRIIAATLGIKGLGRKDASHLRAEQGTDETELLVATAYLKTLTDARRQITTVTEPKLRSQISALTSLGRLEKLSAPETRLLKALKGSLGWQQAQLAKIDTAIYGKPAAVKKAAPPPSASPPGGDTGSAGGSGGAGGPSTPVVTDAQIAAAARIGPGSATAAVLPAAPALSGAAQPWQGGAFSGVPAGSGYQPSPQPWQGAPAQPQQPAWNGGNVERLLEAILHATRAVPAGVSDGVGGAIGGAAQAAAFRRRFPVSGW